MNWLKTFLVGLLNAVVCMVGAFAVGVLWVEWHRISSFEGEAGYFVVFLAILGIPLGMVIGIIAARVVAAKAARPGFFKALGAAVGGTVGLLAVIAGFVWLAADFPPKIDGRELAIEFEVRCPAEFEVPREVSNEDDWFVFVTRDHGNRSQRRGLLRLKEAARIDGRWVIPATVSLHTSDPGKSVGVAMADRESQFFNLPLRSKPTRNEMNWSEWMPGPTFGDLDKIPGAQRVALRYRVQFATRE